MLIYLQIEKQTRGGNHLKKMRKDLIQFMQSAQVKSVGFHLGSVYEDEGSNILTVKLIHVLEMLLYFWRVNLCEKQFKFRGEKDYSDFEIFAFKERANQFLSKHSPEVRVELEDYLREVYDQRTLDYFKERVNFEDEIQLFQVENEEDSELQFIIEGIEPLF